MPSRKSVSRLKKAIGLGLGAASLGLGAYSVAKYRQNTANNRKHDNTELYSKMKTRRRGQWLPKSTTPRGVDIMKDSMNKPTGKGVDHFLMR